MLTGFYTNTVYVHIHLYIQHMMFNVHVSEEWHTVPPVVIAIN